MATAKKRTKTKTVSRSTYNRLQRRYHAANLAYEIQVVVRGGDGLLYTTAGEARVREPGDPVGFDLTSVSVTMEDGREATWEVDCTPLLRERPTAAIAEELDGTGNETCFEITGVSVGYY